LWNVTGACNNATYYKLALPVALDFWILAADGSPVFIVESGGKQWGEGRRLTGQLLDGHFLHYTAAE